MILTVNECRLQILKKEGHDGKDVGVTDQLLMPIGSTFIPTLLDIDMTGRVK